MLKPYSRDSAYFQSIRDRGMTIAYKPLDISFNNMVDYLNKKLLPVVNTLADKKAVGIFGHEGSFLRNIGDGTTVFDFIRGSDIARHSLGLNKIEKQTKYSVIASDNNEILRSITPTSENQVLLVDRTLVPRWEKLKHSHFEDSAIEDEKVAVGTLSVRHLTAGIIGKPLTANSIITSYIQNNNIPLNKIANNSFTNTKISVALMNTRVQGRELQFKDKCFVTRTIANNSVDIKQVFFSEPSRNSNIKLTKLYGILSPANIPLNAIELKKVNSPHTEVKFDVYKQMDSSILPSKIKAGSLHLPSIRNAFSGWRNITNNLVLSKNNLSPEIKAILVNKGGLRP
jgi:hypothetical protein